MQNMGKNIKSYATTQIHCPGERDGSLTANNPNLSATNVIRLNHTHSFLNLQQNFSNKIFHSRFVLWQIPSKLSEIHSNSPTYSELCKIHTSYLCFRHLPRQRTFRNSSELCKFHAIHPCSLRIA